MEVAVFLQAEEGIRGWGVTGVQPLAIPFVVAPIRLAEARCRSGWTAWSFLPTMYQLGLVRHATPGALLLNSSTDGGQAVAQTTFCSSSGRSPQKQAAPPGSIHTRPSATSIWPNAGDLATLSCSPWG